MNDISEIQRLADAFAGLAANLAELVRAAGGSQVVDVAGQANAPVVKRARGTVKAPCASGLPGQG